MAGTYEAAIHTCVGVLIMATLGFIYGLTKYHKQNDVVTINNTVFNVLLPCLVITGLRQQDFLKLDSQTWDYILSFFVLRICMLIISIIITIILRRNIIECVSPWLGTCWISTIILGGPILVSLYGPTFIVFGIFAAFSSFFFQLPIMIVLFEIRQTFFNKNYTNQTKNDNNEININEKDFNDSHGLLANSAQIQMINQQNNAIKQNNSNPNEINVVEELSNENKIIDATNQNQNKDKSLQTKLDKIDNVCLRIIIKILISFVINPVLWAIIIGFIISFIFSSEDLDPKTKFPLWLDYALNTTTGLGSCTTPLGVFVVGLFAAQSLKFSDDDDHTNYRQKLRRIIGNVQFWKYQFSELLLYILLKFLICPAIMLGLARAFNLKCNIARSAVLIATIPVSLASFTLTKRYELKTQSVIALNVIIGTILMLPFVLLWLYILNQNNYFVC